MSPRMAKMMMMVRMVSSQSGALCPLILRRFRAIMIGRPISDTTKAAMM